MGTYFTSNQGLMMSLQRIASLLFLALFVAGSAAAEKVTKFDKSNLIGTWTVDLRPRPGAEPYLKKLVITSVTDDRVEGNFYDGSPLQAGRINTSAKPQLHFAFFTDPGEGAYQSSGRQVGPNKLEGMTLSTTRGFLMPWTAVRDPNN